MEKLKRLYAVPALLALLAITLSRDAMDFLPRVSWDAAGVTNSGTGLYVLGGLFEVNDQIPYCDTPQYFIGLCIVVAVCAICAVASFIGVRLLIKRGEPL